MDVAGESQAPERYLFARELVHDAFDANTDHGLLGRLYLYNEPVGLVSFMISSVEIWLSLILLDLQRWRCSFTFSSLGSLLIKIPQAFLRVEAGG